MINKIIYYFLENRVTTMLLLALAAVWEVSTTPSNWHGGIVPRNPVPVDAIPDIGDDQQTAATEWMGRSPKDTQDQIIYLLTTSLLGIPGVKTIRSSSIFGMSFIYIISEDDTESYWSRSRIPEKLNSLPLGTLPEDVQPMLDPDAMALGQIYWYTLEGRDPKTGRSIGGWNAEELRTIQDLYVKYSLSAAKGVSEVASMGGFVKECQLELNPDVTYSFNVSVMDVMNTVKKSNPDIGAETMEVNKVEYLIRGPGYVKNVANIENTVVTVREGVLVRISDIAFVNIGSGTRRGGLDREGVKAVDDVAIARCGSNPLEVIDNVKEKIHEMDAGLSQKTPVDGTVSKVTIIPFYDRTGLIKETIGTPELSLSREILICITMITVLVLNLRASVIIASTLPTAVLATFILMRYTGIGANIAALSGIAIAIRVIVDVGVAFVESIIRYMEMPENRGIIKGKAPVGLIYKAMSEVPGAVATVMITTIVSLLPVFVMQVQEGKMFLPLAYTKTYTPTLAFVLGLILLPTLTYFLFSVRIDSKMIRRGMNYVLIGMGVVLCSIYGSIPALGLMAAGVNNLLVECWKNSKIANYVNIAIALLVALFYLSEEWLLMGPARELTANMLFVAGCVTIILAMLWALVIFYERILRWCLANRWKFMMILVVTIVCGFLIWRGVGQELMPNLNEGSSLLMPISMSHAGIEQNLDYVEKLDKRPAAIPEVKTATGKWGRVNSALDPASVQMFENTINYRPEYILDEDGRRARFRVDRDGAFVLKDGGTYNPADGFRLLPVDSLAIGPRGDYFRQWRLEIRNVNDIWQQIVDVIHLPGLTLAPKLQPIEARLVMFSTGMRALMGVKAYGPTLEDTEQGGKLVEQALRPSPSVIPSSMFYDRTMGVPYPEIKLNRELMARYGVAVGDLQEVLGVVVGGMALTCTVEGRERFPIQPRYARGLRNSPEALSMLFVPIATGTQVPLKELMDIEYSCGVQMIQSENTFLVGYVTFDKLSGRTKVDAVHEAGVMLDAKAKSGELVLPKGASYKFAGSYEQQQHATDRLMTVIPLALLIVLLVLYFQLRTVTVSPIRFSDVSVASAGGFILLWLHGQPRFMNFSIVGENVRGLFQMHPINLSVTVWVGFTAFFGAATDDGVLMGTYIHHAFLKRDPRTQHDIREAVVEVGLKRVRPATTTTAMTLIVLLSVLTFTGKGADIMAPVAIPAFGGMLIQSTTMLVVPVLQCWWREAVERRREKKWKGAYGE